MKVIDILNKIANGEEVPEKIKIGCSNLTLDEDKENYSYENSDEYYGNKLIHWFNLNEEVEIIENKKIPKKLKCKYTSQIGKIELAKTINEIIDYLEDKQC